MMDGLRPTLGCARLQGERRIEGQSQEQQECEQVAADRCHASNQGSGLL
jgi:hypothetical protein